MSWASLLSIVGLTCNGFGVLFLAREVYLAHKTEEFIIFIRQSLSYAKALRADPLGQSQRDLDELEEKIKKGSATYQERIAHALQKAVRGLPLSEEHLNEIKDRGSQMADRLAKDLTAGPHTRRSGVVSIQCSRSPVLEIAGVEGDRIWVLGIVIGFRDLLIMPFRV